MDTAGRTSRDYGGEQPNDTESAMDEDSVRLLAQSESQKVLVEDDEAAGRGETDISQSETVLDMSSLQAAEQRVPTIGHMGKEECVKHISTLHDDVAKMFVKGPRFDVATLSSVPVTSDPRGFNEDDFQSHRHTSFPHVHHPLKSMRSHSHSAKVKKVKSTKPKKKKKSRLKTVRNFPSKTAMKSPAILEESEDDDDYSEASDSSMSESEEGDLDIPEEDTVNIRHEADEAEHREIPTLIPDICISETGTSETPGPSVGFYIGDDHSDLPGSPMRKASATSFTSVGSHDSSGSLRPPGDSHRKVSTGSVAASAFKRQSSAEPQITPMFEDIDDEPVVSQHASQFRRDSDANSLSPLLDPSSRKGSIQSTGSGAKVTFLLGNDASEADLATTPLLPETLENKENRPPRQSHHSEPGSHHSTSSKNKGKHKHHHHHHHEQFKKEDLLVRRQPGSEIKLDNLLRRVPTEVDEASMLQTADLDDMASHRWEDVRGIRRHKIQKPSGGFSTGFNRMGIKEKEKKKLKFKKKFDHTPHEVFVELDVLYGDESNWQWEWREKARWIKFEEDVEEGAERWGKPHVASLSFHSLLELRKLLENGTLLLDLEADDLPTIFHSVVEKMIMSDQIDVENRGNVLRTLLLKHKHVSERSALIRRNISYLNLMGLEHSDRRHQKQRGSVIRNFSTASFGSVGSGGSNPKMRDTPTTPPPVDSGTKLTDQGEYLKPELVKLDIEGDNMNSDGIHVGFTLPESRHEEKTKQVQEIMKRIPKGAEAVAVLVGTVDFLSRPAMALVRLAEGEMLGNLTEVPLPVRFIFILLGPLSAMDYHEVGRSFSTLMSNQLFHSVAYKAESREDILHAINEFLDESIVLPPGDWDRKTLLPIMDMARQRASHKRKKKQKLDEKDGEKKLPIDPLQRTGVPFGGLINDIKRRYPHYVSDFKDALNPQCFAAFIFIFFACLSPSIAFGGLLGEKTDGWMGVSETILATSIAGVIFGFLSGQPIMIVGYTGPMLLFEEFLYQFCKSYELEYLPMRCWVGLWLFVICMVVVACEGSFLVRYITRFTEEIFAMLISLIFIFEVINKLLVIFSRHPLLEDYCFLDDNSTMSNSSVQSNGDLLTSYSLANSSVDFMEVKSAPHVVNQPNTALLSVILCLGTFLIAYFLRIFRNSKFLGRSVRRALGDFGVVIAILIMVLLDFFIEDTYTQKLEIPDGVKPTHPSRNGWFVNPMGIERETQVWQIFAAIVGASLVFVLMFMETQITQMIMNKKERKLVKGSGYHLDLFILGCIAGVNSLFGLPWLCAATVRSVAHISALTVMSRTHAPGEKPKLVKVMEQRLTGILVNILVGVSLAMGSVLREIPMAVLFGVFLYMGVASMSGVQFFERMKLLLMPVKHHPSISYVRRVKTLKMHLYTILQLLCLAVLWVVKSTAAALAFPFILISLVPMRLKLMGHVFTEKELGELDKEEEADDDKDEEDEPDFYQVAHMPM